MCINTVIILYIDYDYIPSLRIKQTNILGDEDRVTPFMSMCVHLFFLKNYISDSWKHDPIASSSCSYRGHHPPKLKTTVLELTAVC